MTNYEDPGNAQPLLSNEEDAVGAWEGAPDVESPAQNFVGNQCTVNLMLKKHAHDALRFLQTGAMEKIAEFEAEASNYPCSIHAHCLVAITAPIMVFFSQENLLGLD